MALTQQEINAIWGNALKGLRGPAEREMAMTQRNIMREEDYRDWERRQTFQNTADLKKAERLAEINNKAAKKLLKTEQKLIAKYENQKRTAESEFARRQKAEEYGLDPSAATWQDIRLAVEDAVISAQKKANAAQIEMDAEKLIAQNKEGSPWQVAFNRDLEAKIRVSLSPTNAAIQAGREDAAAALGYVSTPTKTDDEYLLDAVAATRNQQGFADRKLDKLSDQQIVEKYKMGQLKEDGSSIRQFATAMKANDFTNRASMAPYAKAAPLSAVGTPTPGRVNLGGVDKFDNFAAVLAGGTQQPGTQQPGTQQPGTRQPAIQQPATRQPATRQPATRQPIVPAAITRQTPQLKDYSRASSPLEWLGSNKAPSELATKATMMELGLNSPYIPSLSRGVSSRNPQADAIWQKHYNAAKQFVPYWNNPQGFTQQASQYLDLVNRERQGMYDNPFRRAPLMPAPQY